MSMDAVEYCVTHAVDIVHLKELQDVMDADIEFPIGFPTIHQTCTIGQLEEEVGLCILCEHRVVFVGQVTHHALDAYHLPQLELLEKGNAVEEFAVDVPLDVERGKTVGEELHVVHQRERPFVEDEREVGWGHDEQGERHTVPLCAAF